MHARLSHSQQALFKVSVCSVVIAVSLVLTLTLPTIVGAQETRGSNTQPLAFELHQSIIDLNELVWASFKPGEVQPGPEIAVLRGVLKVGGLEVMVRLPAHDPFAYHSLTSDEVYVWLKCRRYGSLDRAFFTYRIG